MTLSRRAIVLELAVGRARGCEGAMRRWLSKIALNLREES
jgi:hypothetical protein